MNVLVLPGWQNSGPDHWQSHWEREQTAYRRVEQRDWEWPARDEWIATLEQAIAASALRVVLVAHSLGCVAAGAWAASAPAPSRARVAGAFLVAPADVDRVDAIAPLRAWRPMPRAALPFPSVVVASRTDPYVSFARAADLAASWRSELVDLGDAGHINADAGYGAWPAGHALLRDFIARCGERG